MSQQKRVLLASFPCPCRDPNPFSGFLSSQHQDRDFVNKEIPIMSHLPGLLPRIIACLFPLLCILEALNLRKHLSNLFLQLLQKKYQEDEGDGGKTSRHIQSISSSLNHRRRTGQMVTTAKDVYEMGTTLGWPCWIPDENNWREGQNDVLMSVVNQGWKIKLSQCGGWQRTYPNVDFSSSNNVRCETPSIMPISF